MKDYRKGIIILLLAGLASIIALSVDDRRWEMAFINFGAKAEHDVADLQEQILSGIDPTLNADATAAGPIKRTSMPTCFKGKIARDLQSDLFHDQAYTSIKKSNQTYIEVDTADELTFLVKGTFETQSASVLELLPDDVELSMELASGANSCINLDLYLARIKN